MRQIPPMMPFTWGSKALENGFEKGVGGGSGIRTHDTVSRIHAFQASAFSHSAIPPRVAAGRNIVVGGGLTTRTAASDGPRIGAGSGGGPRLA